MSRVLVIPDTHLKHKMFDLADKIIEENEVDYCVQLGDNVDDFYALSEDYRIHNARMVLFNRQHKVVWLWGNHELSYILGRPVSGNAYAGEEYSKLYEENFSPKLIHIDGKCIFSHAGIFESFLEAAYINPKGNLEESMNKVLPEKLWFDDSPLWARHKRDELKESDYIKKNYIQVIGHTPFKDITDDGSIISVDVFSTNWGRKIGVEEMIIIDTETGKYEQIHIDYRKEFLDKEEDERHFSFE